MRKNAIITACIIVFTALVVLLACIPKILKEYEIKSNQIVKNNCKTAVQDIMDIKDIKTLKDKSFELVKKYNETYTNPVTKKENAFTTDKKCMGCVSVIFDDNTQSLNITGYDKNLQILCRTIVKPPSFVTYEREEK